MDLKEWVSAGIAFLTNVVALLVIINSVIDKIRNWHGSPELRTVRDTVSLFAAHVDRVDKTMQTLVENIRRP